MVIQKIKKAAGQIKVPGDKSISHRAVMLGSLANGVTEIRFSKRCGLSFNY